MTQVQSAEEKARLKKQWTDLAIKQAQNSEWEEAAVTNRNILQLFPTEPEAYNRLGKALSELGLYSDARDAYKQTLVYSPKNGIAQKNLGRLALLQESPATQGHQGGRIDPHLFIEETGKTKVTEIINLAPAAMLARVAVGDQVELHVNGHTLLVRDGSGDDLGQVEPALGNRLINLIESGNRYIAAIRVVENGQLYLIIRETYQHPSNFGKVSFPAQGGGDTIRAYIKDTMLRRDHEDDDELDGDDAYYDGGSEEEEMSEVDFDEQAESED
jgi:tetratricopeptide (TPR) repeat protein